MREFYSLVLERSGRHLMRKREYNRDHPPAGGTSEDLVKTSRRSFLRISGTGAAATLVAGANSIELVAQASRALGTRTPEDVAADEGYWRDIQQAFSLDRSVINLNNGNSCPSPTVVHEAYKRYLDWSNQAPVYHRGMIERNIEVVRRRLAAEFGCDPEEMAITRNSSESLQIAQNGLDLAPGDEVLTTEQDYGRMLTTWDQRARRDKIVIKKINFPVPTTGETLYGLLEGAITPRTKVLHFCHITNLTGQIFPVQNISRMARARGIITIVDGAHAVAHFPFKLRDLEMDYYGTSLHKWLLAPTGTGFLYVRRERIAKTWPLQAAPERSDNDIRKFEEIGTSPAATKAAINEALAFHQAVGTERVAARLRYLTLRWANKLKTNPRIVLHTGLDQVYGVACVGIKDIPAPKIYDFLWGKYRIITATINRPEYNGVRVTPNIYTPLEEIDVFVAAMEDLLKNGPPATA
jgi:selenocysteine lyase/cysteine desulfurase